MRHSGSWGGRLAFVALLNGLLLLALPSRAHAYAWMIRHDYTACSMCHADPSGGGLLTAYGRAQGEVLLRTQYGHAQEEPGPVADFLFGAVKLPESVLLGGDLRALYLEMRPSKGPKQDLFVWMQSDLEGQVTFDRLRANASVGYAHEGARPAAITHNRVDNVVSRVHWVGVDLGSDKQMLLRVGRMNLPFAIRSIEHTMWVRSSTRTDSNDAQQHGVALAYNGDGLRAEVMGIAGNFQIAPTEYRSRGYSGYFEYAPLPKLALGASSLIVHAERDLLQQVPTWRHAHGLFARASPIMWMVFNAEGDYLLTSTPAGGPVDGYAAMLQADVEPIQGVHLIGTGEVLNQAAATQPAWYGAWASLAWFFAPHADLRVDAIWQSVTIGTARTGMTSLLGQLHLYL